MDYVFNNNTANLFSNKEVAREQGHGHKRLPGVRTHNQYSPSLEQCLVVWWIFHNDTSVFEELIPSLLIIALLPSIKFYIFHFCFCFRGIVVPLNPFLREI